MRGDDAGDSFHIGNSQHQPSIGDKYAVPLSKSQYNHAVLISVVLKVLEGMRAVQIMNRGRADMT